MSGSDSSRGGKKVALRRRLLLAGWTLAAAALLARAVQVQVVEGETWQRLAEKQHRKSLEIPAPRGAILDRDGAELAVSHERYRISVAPGEVNEPERVREALTAALEVSPAEADRVVGSERPWVVLPGRYAPSVREELGRLRGVYLERELERVYPYGQLAMGSLGRVRDGRGVGGVEQVLDSILRGRPGREVQARDNVGQPIPGESYVVRAPRSGGGVVLTLDLDLQEIAREALSSAIEETGARGGDLLITDPRTGEILSMVSLRDGRSTGLSAINTPYEPGSTLKPFTVAGLLAGELASLSDSIDAEEGRWRVAGRTLTDVHAHGTLSLADALRVSSNVAVAKAARAMTPAQQYQNLRAFGFGVPTGVDLPGEAAGTLRRPEDWSLQSPASLAIGYEVAVTPIQMAMAYGALANGGWLMEPRIVREVRGTDGSALERRGPRRIRRAVPEQVAEKISRVLVDVVEDGTGTRARLSTFRVAGKSGTSRAYASLDGYQRDSYYASFVGYFPAEKPQLVVFVKLERPEGAYYGGSTAAPVTRATLEAILAARRAPLDRRALVSIARSVDRGAAGSPVRFASLDAAPGGSGAVQRPIRTDVTGEGVPVPDVEGLPLRAAVRRLHAVGLRVLWDGSGTVGSTRPPPGRRLAPGDTVRLGGFR